MHKKGSFTLELTILMPFIITFILIISFLVLYLYNRNVMQNAASRGVKQCFYYENETNEEIQKECEKTVLADLEQYMVGVDELEMEIAVTKYKVSVELTGTLNVPQVILLENISLDTFWKYRVKAEETRLKPSELLRGSTQIKDLIGADGKAEEYDEY